MAKKTGKDLPTLEEVKDAKFVPVTEGVTTNTVGGAIDENLEVAKEISETIENENADETANENVTNENHEKELVIPQPTEDEVSKMESGIYESGIDTITSEKGSVSDLPTIERNESPENYTLGNSENVSVTVGVVLENLVLESKKANPVVEEKSEEDEIELIPESNTLIELKMEFEPVTHREKEFLTTTHNGDLLYLPLENVVKEGDKVFIPYWLYKIKFK